MVNVLDRRNVAIYLAELKSETDPLKREVLEQLLIAKVDKTARHDIMSLSRGVSAFRHLQKASG